MKIKRRSLVVWVTSVILLAGLIPNLVLAGKPFGGDILIRGEIEVEVGPSVAYNSQWEEYLVVFWNDRPGCDDIRAERVSRDGKLLGGTWIAAGCPEDHRHPDVAYNSKENQYLIAWIEESGGNNLVIAQRFSADLIPQPEGRQTLLAGVNGSLTSAHPAVAYAYTANKYLVVWDYEMNLPPNPVVTHIIGHVVQADGIPDPAGTIDISLDSGGDPREQPDVAYNVARNEYLVVWQQVAGPGYDIYGRRITGHGELLFPEFIQITPFSNDQLRPAVGAVPNAGPDGQYLVVWEEHGSNIQIYGFRINGDGTKLDVHNWILAPGWHRNPAIVGSDSARRYLVVATRDEGVTNDWLCAQEVSPTGDILSGFRVGETSCFGGPTADYAAVGAGPMGGFLVAWQDKPSMATQTDIHGQLWGNRVYLPLIVR